MGSSASWNLSPRVLALAGTRLANRGPRNVKDSHKGTVLINQRRVLLIRGSLPPLVAAGQVPELACLTKAVIDPLIQIRQPSCFLCEIGIKISSRDSSASYKSRPQQTRRSFWPPFTTSDKSVLKESQAFGPAAFAWANLKVESVSILSKHRSFRTPDAFPWVSIGFKGGFLERRVPGQNGNGR